MGHGKRTWKKLWSVLLTVALCLTILPTDFVKADSETVEAVPRLQISTNGQVDQWNTGVGQGQWFYINIEAYDLKDVGGLDFSIPYDTDIFQVSDVYVGDLLSDEKVLSDVRKEEGIIQVSAISADGITGNGSLIQISGYLKDDAAVGEHTLKILLGEWYDTDRNTVDIQRGESVFTVKEGTGQKDALEFAMFTVPGKYEVKKGNRIHCVVSCTNLKKLAGGSIVFNYDAKLFKLLKITPTSELKEKNVVYTVNDNVPGNIKTSFLCDQAINEDGYLNLFELDFQVTGNYEGDVTITGTPEGLVSEDLEEMTGKTMALFLRQSLVEEIDENNKMWLEPEAGENSNELKLALKITSEKGVAAGDFKLIYNSDYLICKEVTVDDGVGKAGGYLITNEKIDGGQVSFSYVDSKGNSGEQTLLHLTFQKSEFIYDDLEVVLSGKNVVDKDFKDVKLSYVPYTIYLYDPDATESPEPSQTPESTDKPKSTDKPETSRKPGTTDKPTPSRTPGSTDGPEVSQIPGVTEVPQAPQEPQPPAGQDTGSDPSLTGEQGNGSVAGDMDRIGYTHNAGSLSYTIVKKAGTKQGEVFVKKARNKKLTSVVIPKKVKIGKKWYKVTGIAKNAFKGCKSLKKITIKTKTLKKVGKNAIKGIYKKAKIICPKKKKVYIKKYKKLFKKNTGYRKTMKIK